MKTKPCPKCHKKMIEWDDGYYENLWKCLCGYEKRVTRKDQFKEAWEEANRVLTSHKDEGKK